MCDVMQTQSWRFHESFRKEVAGQRTGDDPFNAHQHAIVHICIHVRQFWKFLSSAIKEDAIEKALEPFKVPLRRGEDQDTAAGAANCCMCLHRLLTNETSTLVTNEALYNKRRKRQYSAEEADGSKYKMYTGESDWAGLAGWDGSRTEQDPK